MLQILLLIGGIYALVKGEIKLTKTRVLSPLASRIIGGVFVLISLVSIIIPAGFLFILGATFITAAVGACFAKKRQ